MKSYDIIHIHIGHITGLYAKAFRELGAKKIICHAHTTKCVNPKHNLFMPVFKLMANRYSDYNLGCGKMAGNFCFGKGRFEFVKNSKIEEVGVYKTADEVFSGEIIGMAACSTLALALIPLLGYFHHNNLAKSIMKLSRSCVADTNVVLQSEKGSGLAYDLIAIEFHIFT